MRHTYLARLWRQDKKLAFVLSLFLVGQAFFTYKQIETVPFFNFGMYARPTTTTRYTAYRLYDQRNQALDLYNYQAPHFLAYQLQFYTQLYQQASIDAPLQQTIRRRFHRFPPLQDYLVRGLSNDTTSLAHARQWFAKETELNKLSLWRENYVWVNDNFKLVTKSLVYKP